MFDDDLPQKKKTSLKNLEPLSLDDLKTYIDELQAEIVRAQGEIDRKSAHMNAASALFKIKSE
ncbi:MAG TPA: DUF1192 domain-containing protein [Alphaproteobacteria bacterium]|nr:DUF1192 domain-containing protein [Alphaproteobacteria bacterium]HNS44559.1 DUF1192 domain-containing protein [Alphaproteobacteria bacterium]